MSVVVKLFNVNCLLSCELSTTPSPTAASATAARAGRRRRDLAGAVCRLSPVLPPRLFIPVVHLK